MKYDAIIVLGNEMEQNGVLNIESKARMDKAIEYFKNSVASIMVTCGWDYRKDSKIAIAEAMKSYAIKKGVLGSKIRTECASRDTVGDAFFTKVNYSIPKKWQKLIVVTSDYHVERTFVIFDFIYGEEYQIDVVGAGNFKNELKIRSELKSLQDFNNTFDGVSRGNVKEVYFTLKTKHPFYNGAKYSMLEILL